MYIYMYIYIYIVYQLDFTRTISYYTVHIVSALRSWNVPMRNSLIDNLNRGTPSHHPFLDGIFPYKPSILGYPHFRKHPYIYIYGYIYIYMLDILCMEEILHQLADGFHYNPIVPVFHSYQELQLLVQDFVHGAGRFSILEEDPLWVLQEIIYSTLRKTAYL